jgi:tRNA threonylcarbamoyladenosine biosynthesis protein TsaE
MKFIIQSVESLSDPIQYLKSKILNLDIAIIIFQGEMGAGKTTFIRKFIESYNSDIIANSPTYNIMNQYKITDTLTFYHFDLFRIKSSITTGDHEFDDIWGKLGISLIEWGDFAMDYFPFITSKVSITVENNTRIIEII